MTSTRKSFSTCLSCACLALVAGFLLLGCTSPMSPSGAPAAAPAPNDSSGYDWTTDHMHVGVRWQPFGFAKLDAYDGSRPVIAEDSSYAQFWVAWSASEPTEKSTDYANHMSGYLKTIERAVDICVAEGVKVEFVFWHRPAWATVSGESGGYKPKEDYFAAFMTRIATHFKGRVHAYQLAHEANLSGFMEDGTIDTYISEIFTKGAQAIRAVYDAAPAEQVIVSTSGCSPCDACATLAGLKGKGAAAIHDFYDRLIADQTLMRGVDALNLNVSDHFDGYGNSDGSYLPSVWANYDLARGKLDAAGYRGKKVLAAESWVVWDDANNAMDVNGDGLKNEQDAYSKTLTIMGKCLERGLNTMNLPWSDNSSTWAMGLTKRRDYNGRIKEVNPDIVIPAIDGGPDIVTTKFQLKGTDKKFTIEVSTNEAFTVEDYINPPDPNHLHYYIWKWYAQIAGGSDEVIRHALAGDFGNDVLVWGLGFTGSERYRMSSYNRTQDKFTVLIYSGGASGKVWTKVAIPATIQHGRYYNNEYSTYDFRGEGFAEGDQYKVRIETKDISMTTGEDVDLKVSNSPVMTVSNDVLNATVGQMNKFTKIEFMRVPVDGK